jgi:excisionase family DNA binding protein
MNVIPDFLTIKEAAHHVNRSEQTIRRLVKQHALTSHVRIESTLKGVEF